MTPVPYILTATAGEDGLFSATLAYANQTVATGSELKEKHIEGWAQSAAEAHKESISPRETYGKKTVIARSFVA